MENHLKHYEIKVFVRSSSNQLVGGAKVIVIYQFQHGINEKPVNLFLLVNSQMIWKALNGATILL